jgi:hypothetical protein
VNTGTGYVRQHDDKKKVLRSDVEPSTTQLPAFAYIRHYGDVDKMFFCDCNRDLSSEDGPVHQGGPRPGAAGATALGVAPKVRRSYSVSSSTTWS